MKRIGFIINYIVKNGPSSVILNILNNLDRNEFKPFVITLFEGNDQEIIKSLKADNVKVYECRSLSRIKCMCGIDKEFRDIVEKEKIDILHTHGFVPDILSSNLKMSIKKISTIHNNMFEDYLNVYGKIKSKIFIKIHLTSLRKLDEVICCSESVYNVMKNHLKNVSYICNGIDQRQINCGITRANLKIPENARVFLYAGALNTRKNIVWLINEFIKYHNDNEYFIILGTGDKASECNKLSDNNVKLLGFHKNSLEYMEISDVYISASKSEGFSIAVLEALSCGLGLFLSDIASHREIIEMSETVYLGEIFKQDTFAEGLNRIRKQNLKKNAIKEFQNKELSACEMTKRYQHKYRG